MAVFQMLFFPTTNGKEQFKKKEKKEFLLEFRTAAGAVAKSLKEDSC